MGIDIEPAPSQDGAMSDRAGHLDSPTATVGNRGLGEGGAGGPEAAVDAVDLPDVARDQLGVLTRSQILAAGITKEQLRWKLGRTWRIILPGVVLLEPGLPSHDQRLVGALLLAGPRSWLAGPTAAHLHGLPGAPDLTTQQRVHVLVPAPSRPRTVLWVSIRRTRLVGEHLIERGSIRYSCRARAVVDAAALAATEGDARALIIGAIQRGLVRADDLAHWIEARQPRGRRVLRRALVEAMAGVWSVPEGDLIALLCTSTVLPEPIANPFLEDDCGRRLTTPDVWIDDVALAVMVHSRQFHEGVDQWEQTVMSDTDLTAARVVVVTVTPASLASNPASILRRVEAAYVEARRIGFRAPVRATPRHGPIRPAS